MKNMLNFIDKYKYIFVSGFLGFVAFIIIYGTKILNPTNINWIIRQNGDVAQHYLGWEFFRRSLWTFPVGMNNIILYPNSISVIFTDSIPIFALFFKVFSKILPQFFQYLGIYGMLCFILQGITSSIILKKFIKNDYLVILLSLLFILSPIMIYRMYYHTSLASHYLIFLGFILILYKDKISSNKMMLFWGLLGMLCASIHIYFLAIDGIILIGYVLYEYLDKNIKKALLSLLSYLLMSIFIVFILGGFSLQQKTFGNSTIDGFNFNLNGFFNPLENYSIIINEMPVYSDLQTEGFAYLGLGIIISIALTIVIYMYKKIKKENFKFDKKVFIVIMFMCLTSLFIAGSPNFYFGKILIFKYHIPESINNVIGLFRSNGRFIWICYYIIIFTNLFVLYKLVNKKVFIALTIILLSINIYDISGILKEKRNEYKNSDYEMDLRDKRWNKLFEEDFKHLILSEDQGQYSFMYEFDVMALKYNKTVNRFYIVQNFLEEKIRKYLDKINENTFDDSIFIIYPYEYMKYKNLNVNFYELEGLYIATKMKLDYLKTFDSNSITIYSNNDYNEIGLDDKKSYNVVVMSDSVFEKNDFEINNCNKIKISDNILYLEVENVDKIEINLKKQREIKIYIEEK